MWRIVVVVNENAICGGGPLGAALGRFRKVEGSGLRVESRTQASQGIDEAMPSTSVWVVTHVSTQVVDFPLIQGGIFRFCGKFILALAAPQRLG